jgi:hypothetical protein
MAIIDNSFFWLVNFLKFFSSETQLPNEKKSGDSSWMKKGPVSYGILTPLYGKLNPHGILSMVFWPPTHGILIPYPWYIDPHIHGIFTPLTMVYRTPYPWYFDPLPISWLEMRGINIPWGFNLPYRGVKIPYDTGPFFIHELSPDV